MSSGPQGPIFSSQITNYNATNWYRSSISIRFQLNIDLTQEQTMRVYMYKILITTNVQFYF